MIVFSGRDVEWRNIEEEDAERLCELINCVDVQTNLHASEPRAISVEAEKEWIRKNGSNHTNYSWIIQDKSCGEIIGAGGYKNLFLKNGSVEIGLWIGKAYWNKGLGTDALRALVNYLFTQFPLNRIELNCHSFNSLGIRCYEKIGFIPEGRKRQSTFRNGQWHDQITMAILRQEWEVMPQM